MGNGTAIHYRALGMYHRRVIHADRDFDPTDFVEMLATLQIRVKAGIPSARHFRLTYTGVRSVAGISTYTLFTSC